MPTEHVDAEVLSHAYHAGQLVERMGWALVDAEKHEETVTFRRSSGHRAAVRTEVRMF
jgi:SLT domain-containing protein